MRPPRQRRNAKLCSSCAQKAGKRTCSSCGDEVFVDLAIGTRCRPCISKMAHAKRLAETYSITAEEYAAILAHQGGACYICRRKPGAKRLACDHDHACCPGPISCGKCVRGLLCRSCNRDVLGHLKDDPAALLRAVEYLARPPAREVLGDATPRQPVQ